MLLAAAIEILHLGEFLEKWGTLESSLQQKITELVEYTNPEAMMVLETIPGYSDLIEQYGGYVNEPLTGNHGSTARYWIDYTGHVKDFLLFSRTY